MCNDPSPMSKSKAIVIKILGPDGKWKTLKTDSVTKGTKKLKKTYAETAKTHPDNCCHIPAYPVEIQNSPVPFIVLTCTECLRSFH